MGLSADHPNDLIERVTSEGGREHFRYAGYGVADVSLAEASEDNRVVMAVEDSLPIDRFAVYEVPIPTDFQTERGTDISKYRSLLIRQCAAAARSILV